MHKNRGRNRTTYIVVPLHTNRGGRTAAFIVVFLGTKIKDSIQHLRLFLFFTVGTLSEAEVKHEKRDKLYLFGYWNFLCISISL